MNNESPQSHTSRKTGKHNLVLYLLCTVVSSVVTALSAMMMALGSGLASSPEEPVPTASLALWGIGGLAFLPCTVLLILLVGTHRAVIARTLGVLVIAAGILTAIGWFINSGGEMPGTNTGDAIVVLVMVVPLIAGSLMLWKSNPSSQV